MNEMEIQTKYHILVHHLLYYLRRWLRIKRITCNNGVKLRLLGEHKGVCKTRVIAECYVCFLSILPTICLLVASGKLLKTSECIVANNASTLATQIASYVPLILQRKLYYR